MLAQMSIKLLSSPIQRKKKHATLDAADFTHEPTNPPTTNNEKKNTRAASPRIAMLPSYLSPLILA
jgi:hypothetical protein